MSELRILAVFLVIVAVVVAARALGERRAAPQAIWLVVLGVAAGFLPWLPEGTVPPELVLFGFLPPLVYHAAFFSAPREARADALPIMTLAFGLTMATTLAVAACAHWLLPGLGWTAAFAFGAALAPTDAVAATSVLQRLGAPPRLVTILEGESLINDGVALTVFGLAVESLDTPFTLGHGALRLVEVVAGGVLFGLAVGAVAARARRLIRDRSSQLLVSLAIPYLAYVPAEELGVSGVLATVTAGFYLGTRTEGMLQPASRLAGQAFWTILTFLLESTLFVLLGLEIRHVLAESGHRSPAGLLPPALAVAAVVILVRLGWELCNAPLARLVPGGERVLLGMSWRQRLVIGLAGLRGAISMALVLSLPAAVGRERGTLVFVAALVVLVTLVGQAPLLSPVLHRLGLVETDRRRRELVAARKATLEAALARLDELAADERVDEETADTVRHSYEHRLGRIRAELDEGRPRVRTDMAELRGELVAVQREKLAALYRKGRIGAETMRAVRAELDLEDARGGAHQPP